MSPVTLILPDFGPNLFAFLCEFRRIWPNLVEFWSHFGQIPPNFRQIYTRIGRKAFSGRFQHVFLITDGHWCVFYIEVACHLGMSL